MLVLIFDRLAPGSKDLVLFRTKKSCLKKKHLRVQGEGRRNDDLKLYRLEMEWADVSKKAGHEEKFSKTPGKEVHATGLLTLVFSSAGERRPAGPHDVVKAPPSIVFERVCLGVSRSSSEPKRRTFPEAALNENNGWSWCQLRVDGPMQVLDGALVAKNNLSLPENSPFLISFRANKHRLGAVGTSVPGMGHLLQAVDKDQHLVSRPFVHGQRRNSMWCVTL